jgi:acetyl-CoA C-acetyltransferase
MDAFIYNGLRTPFGRHAGALSGVRADDLLGGVIRALVARAGIAPDLIEDVIVGNASQAGEDGRNVARHAVLAAGLPVTVPGLTVNRLCGSGLAALLDAARMVALGLDGFVIAGGVESMSRGPFLFAKNATPWGRDIKVFDASLGARFPNPRIEAQYGADTMPETADNVARDLGLARAEVDRFALASQAKYAAARQDGFFTAEIEPVVIAGRKGDMTVAEDEQPRPDTTADGLAKLKPLFEGGVVTAGNASGINDGAVALLVGSRKVGERAGLQPLARIVASAVAGVEPRVMGLGPVPAARKALERASLSLADMDVIEINEAFAAQALGCLTLLDLDQADSRVNPNGGAVALGHPLGASGARLALTATRQLHRIGGRYALASLCIGSGQGIAAIIEKV